MSTRQRWIKSSIVNMAKAVVIFSLWLVTGCDLFKKPPEVILIGPPKGATVELTVTFSWEIKHSYGKVYRTEVCTDKGVNPFDGWNEDTFDAGIGSTTLTVTLSETRYSGQRFEWGVGIWDGEKSYTSEVWWLQVK